MVRNFNNCDYAFNINPNEKLINKNTKYIFFKYNFFFNNTFLH